MTTRELVLIGIVALVCIMALVRPRYGLYGYIWYALMRPDVLAWVEDSRNVYSFAILICTAAGSVLYVTKAFNVFKTPVGRLLCLLQIPILISVFAAFNPELSYPRYTDYIKMILALMLIPILITTEEALRELMCVTAFSLGFVAMKFGVFGVVYGGVQLVGGYGPVLSDNNFVALAFATIAPFLWFSTSFARSKLFRLIFLGMGISAIPAVIMTNSRGGSLALVVGVLYVAVRSRRKAVIAVLLLAIIGGSVFMVRSFYVDRISSVAGYEEEASAYSRILHAKAALKMFADYPLMGVGFGGLNYAALSLRYNPDVTGTHVAHNSHLQILVDAGIFAFIFYVAAYLWALLWLERIGRQSKGIPERQAMCWALQSSILVFLVGGTFYSANRVDLPYILLFSVAAYQLILSATPAEAISTPALAPAIPPPFLPATPPQGAVSLPEVPARLGGRVRRILPGAR